MSLILKLIKLSADLFLTLFFWLYFLLGYILFYIPVIIVSYPFIDDRDDQIQKMNSFFFRSFFELLAALTPGLSIAISSEVKKIRSSVIISNHRSYLDPILLMSIFPRHKTIVKGIFFSIPLIKWIMKAGGFIPYNKNGKYNRDMEKHLNSIPAFMKKGGNLFIFPEGRRSRDGLLGEFQKGAFSIACKYEVPLEMLYIHNTDRLFPPGRFFLNTCIQNAISVEKLGNIEPSIMTSRKMKERAVALYQNRVKSNKHQ